MFDDGGTGLDPGQQASIDADASIAAASLTVTSTEDPGPARSDDVTYLLLIAYWFMASTIAITCVWMFSDYRQQILQDLDPVMVLYAKQVTGTLTLISTCAALSNLYTTNAWRWWGRIFWSIAMVAIPIAIIGLVAQIPHIGWAKDVFYCIFILVYASACTYICRNVSVE